ncbi:hypothetical protein [Niabella ginsengisoli]|uniref:Uncharacterized protein n=1 Tax=Niabella ginsengisoli TaxID=522298 RepID=A0ABS9SQ30_9BACT|nr:hypothetical protein [Niabella ginsengisoli]MCH5600459.1 hypothetical protein [Niabella ginsengisoli]
MKSRLLLFATIFLSIAVYAQDVKVKKGYITVDGKSVAKIERKDNVCTISDLNAKPLFTAMITNQTPLNNQSSKKWLQLVGNNGNVKEIALDKAGEFTFSYKQHVAECLVLNNPSLFLAAISEPAVNSFFKTKTVVFLLPKTLPKTRCCK